MLRNTFIHLPGVGRATEKRLWQAGYHDWNSIWEALQAGVSFRDLFRDRRQLVFDFDDTEPDLELVNWFERLDRSIRAFEDRDFGYFLPLLRPSDHWRLLPDLASNALYLDIETTGLSRSHHYITLIGALYRGEFYQWAWSERLKGLDELLRVAPAVITFNGARFDLPFIREHIPSLPIPKAHIDLLYSARAAGFKGGQKAIEELLGLTRRSDLVGFDGEAAVAAWCAGLYGTTSQYDRLLAYNRADVEMLPTVAHALVDQLRRECDFNVTNKIDAPPNRISEVAHRPLDIALLRQAWRCSRPEFARLKPNLNSSLGREAVVVGIDLRGNPARPTGWALCRGQVVQTAVLYDDDEIYTRTVSERPDLVSIDAPLFLPRGRKSVLDDSPCREVGGIVREAERVLWSRGIRVYPALIKQMQGLTSRGIALSKRLMAQGIQVIESYPGAAQDLLNIPRKQQGESLLASGLREFGYIFDTIQSHDELDAITSAMVGHFYLAGHFEAIGAPDEGFMILPKSASLKWPENYPRRAIVSLLGIPGSGKSTLATRLSSEYGYDSFGIGHALRQQAAKDPNLRQALNEGCLAPEPLVERLVKDATTKSPCTTLILDGFPRHAGQLCVFTEYEVKWIFVYIDVPIGIAAARLAARKTCAACGSTRLANLRVCPQCGRASTVDRPEDGKDIIDQRLADSANRLKTLIQSIPPASIIYIDGSKRVEDQLDEIAAAIQSI